MTPSCQHCGSFVTAAYVRVFAPTDAAGVECCLSCDDRTRSSRDADGWREANSPAGDDRHGSGVSDSP